ncbi:MAG: hypothetical protein JWP37_3282 [Mucilaginibacter sp.]|nr:hypothetical protein [Mucilaginibacter sp.]
MKRGKSNIQKVFVLSHLVIYLFIVLTYIFYLPKYNSLRASTTYTRIIAPLALNPTHHVNHSSGNILVLIHQVYKSTAENKRDVLNSLSWIAINILSLLIGGIILLDLFQKTGRHFKSFRYSHQYAYLSYCALRI